MSPQIDKQRDLAAPIVAAAACHNDREADVLRSFLIVLSRSLQQFMGLCCSIGGSRDKKWRKQGTMNSGKSTKKALQGNHNSTQFCTYYLIVQTRNTEEC